MNERSDGKYMVIPLGESEQVIGTWGIVNEGDTDRWWSIDGCDQPLDDSMMAYISPVSIEEKPL